MSIVQFKYYEYVRASIARAIPDVRKLNLHGNVVSVSTFRFMNDYEMNDPLRAYMVQELKFNQFGYLTEETTKDIERNENSVDESIFYYYDEHNNLIFEPWQIGQYILFSSRFLYNKNGIKTHSFFYNSMRGVELEVLYEYSYEMGVVTETHLNEYGVIEAVHTKKFKNGLIISHVVKDSMGTKMESHYYTYNSCGILEKQTNFLRQKDGVDVHEDFYLYNDYGFVQSYIRQRIDETLIFKKEFEYKYDSQGNWIEKKEYDEVSKNRDFYTQEIEYAGNL
ncbi:MAG: hypothetical protein R6U95_01540 [Bacteroidales bacterium]